MGADENKGYEEIKRIGKGGCGTVYLVKKENKYYALKKIALLTKEETNYYQKLLNILFKIKSEYVIKYYESYLVKNFLCIVMEYGGNSDLKKYIDKQESLIDEKIIKDIIIQICLGLKEIHKNKLIHRDLTPDNIFINKNKKIKIGDFGVSKVLTTTNDYTISQVGKLHYYAPEIDKGQEYNNKVDIYSLGCIIYELFTLNEYYNVKNENGKINTEIYNPKWQILINLMLNDDYRKRPDIEETLNYITNKSDFIKNEIICYYNKKDKKKINLLYDYDYDYDLIYNYIESYCENKNNINEENIEIYKKDKKIKFCYTYKGDEIGLIKIKFKFKKLLASSTFMFRGSSSLQSIDLSSFVSKNIINMSYMFNGCSSLE